MLTVRERQEKLKVIGLYKGKIDGIEGKLTKQAYKDVYNYFYNGENQIQQRTTNYNNFVNNTYTEVSK